LAASRVLRKRPILIVRQGKVIFGNGVDGGFVLSQASYDGTTECGRSLPCYCSRSDLAIMRQLTAPIPICALIGTEISEITHPIRMGFFAS
jgi:hypothetical protein